MLPAIWVTLPVPLHCGQATEPASLPPAAVAGGALLVAGDFDLGLGAADRLPEADVQAVFEIGALFAAPARRSPPPPPPWKNWLKMSLNDPPAPPPPRSRAGFGLGLARALNSFGKIEPAEIHVGMACGRRHRPGRAPAANPFSE